MTAVSPSSSVAGQALDAAGLFERYGQELYRFCLGRLRNPEDAADALQNTFLRVHVALERGTVPQFEAAWLYKIAHNVCLSRREQAGRRSAHETPSDLDELEWALAAPEHDHERLEGLADALADLPHNLRQSLLLREWQGLSYAEIADALDTTVPAVETLLYRARKQLAAALEQGGRKARAALGGLLDLLGVRALVGRLSTVLSGAGAAKLAVGAALIAAAGGSALATADAVGTHAKTTPAPGGSRVSVAYRSPTHAPAGAPHSTARALAPDASGSDATPATPSSPPHAAPTAPATPAATGATAPLPPTTATIPAASAAVPALVQPPAADVASAPSTPTLPSAPSAPTAPTAPALPQLPSAPTLTTPTVQTPTAPALPALPSAPTVPQTPTAPSAPSLPSLGG